jgi:hypothetical protein
MLACGLYGKDKEMMMTPSLEHPEESLSPSPSARLRHWMQQGRVVAPFVYNKPASQDGPTSTAYRN